MSIYDAIREKRTILRDAYGGMMSLSDLSKELGMNSAGAKAWAAEQGVGVQIGRRVKFETDQIAKIIVQRRGAY